jgi:hypothetical protein
MGQGAGQGGFERATDSFWSRGCNPMNRAGFDLRFCTWGDTRIGRVRIGWQAIGPMKDDEMWDVE